MHQCTNVHIGAYRRFYYKNITFRTTVFQILFRMMKTKLVHLQHYVIKQEWYGQPREHGLFSNSNSVGIPTVRYT